MALCRHYVSAAQPPKLAFVMSPADHYPCVVITPPAQESVMIRLLPSPACHQATDCQSTIASPECPHASHAVHGTLRESIRLTSLCSHIALSARPVHRQSLHPGFHSNRQVSTALSPPFCILYWHANGF